MMYILNRFFNKLLYTIEKTGNRQLLYNVTNNLTYLCIKLSFLTYNAIKRNECNRIIDHVVYLLKTYIRLFLSGGFFLGIFYSGIYG